MTTAKRTGIRRLAGTVAVLAAAAIVAAACSSSTNNAGGSSNGGTVAALPNNTQGVTSSTITIGATTPQTGPAAPGYSEIAPATNAYFKYANDHGGIFGRKINYVVYDDAYDPSKTATLTRQLVLQNNIFADVEPLGTPTVLQVKDFLKTEGVPAVYVASGCNCWNDPALPYTFGWQPPYTDEGKILGQYVTQHLSGQKVGYLYQDDEFGQDGVKGLDQQISGSNVVSRQTYTATPQALAAGLGSQMSALKSAGAQVVVMYTIPAATALAMLAAATIGYHPQWVISSVGSDPPTLTGLLGSFSHGAAGATLLNGVISEAYLPPLTDAANPWIVGFKKILSTYDPGAPWDGNTEYGVVLGYTFVQALQAAGHNLTRSALVSAIEQHGSTFLNPGLVPFTFSKSNHYGYQGGQMVQLENGGQTINTLGGRLVATINGPITTETAPLSTPPANFGS